MSFFAFKALFLLFINLIFFSYGILNDLDTRQRKLQSSTNITFSSAYQNYTPSFAIVTSFTLNNPFLTSKTANLGLLYGFKGISLYCLMHGYYFLPIFLPPPKEEHNWNRVKMTMQLFQHKSKNEVSCAYDWAVWMESDHVIY